MERVAPEDHSPFALEEGELAHGGGAAVPSTQLVTGVRPRRLARRATSLGLALRRSRCRTRCCVSGVQKIRRRSGARALQGCSEHDDLDAQGAKAQDYHLLTARAPPRPQMVPTLHRLSPTAQSRQPPAVGSCPLPEAFVAFDRTSSKISRARIGNAELWKSWSAM